METPQLKRSVRSVREVLVLASGAVATAFGVLAAAHMMFGAVRFALTLAGV